MIYSVICVMVIVHICMLNLLSVLFSYNQPRWLVYSKYRLLIYLYLFTYVSVFLCFFSLYEAQFSTMSRTSIIQSEIPKCLVISFIAIIASTLALHFFREKALETSEPEKHFLSVSYQLCQYNAIFVLLFLDLGAFYINSFFVIFSSLGAFLLPQPQSKNLYWVNQAVKNTDNYWKNAYLTLGLMSFTNIYLRSITDYLKWPFFNTLALAVNKNIAWDLTFLALDFESSYPYSENWLISEIIILPFICFISYKSLYGRKLTNRHTFPLTILTAIFCRTTSLRVFAVATGIKIAFLLELIS